jgi:5-hydroxyisourate hydrolase
MSTITTHVLDTRSGRPAAGVMVRLELVEAGGNRPVATGATDADGRIRDWLPAGGVPPGEYCLAFETGAWFEAAGQPTIYPEICVTFLVAEGQPHYHIPLLLAPFGYTTYRGS